MKIKLFQSKTAACVMKNAHR